MANKIESYAGTQSVIRALRLLKAFDDRQPEWTLNELVTETGLNKTTTFRLLTALESEGLIRRTDSGNYRLGSEIIALGGRAMRANQLRTVSHTPLRALAAKTGETSTLEVLRPDNSGRLTTLVIDEVLGRYRVGINQYIGSRLPVHATSTGKSLLAFSEPATVERVMLELDAIRAAHPENNMIESAELAETLVEVRANGYSTAQSELEAGVMATAAPIFDHMGHVQAALCIVGPSIRVNANKLQEFSQMVRETTAQISYALGYRAVD